MAAMAFGNVVAQAVYVAAKLGLADLLETGPKSVEELARASGTGTDRGDGEPGWKERLRRLLRY